MIVSEKEEKGKKVLRCVHTQCLLVTVLYLQEEMEFTEVILMAET